MSDNVVPLKSVRRQPLPMPSTAITAMDVLELEAPGLADQLFFTLTRRKRGTEVGLKMGRLWWNLSLMTQTYPASFAEAREWVAGYARRFGYEVLEAPRRSCHR